MSGFDRDSNYITTRITADGRDGFPVEPGTARTRPRGWPRTDAKNSAVTRSARERLLAPSPRARRCPLGTARADLLARVAALVPPGEVTLVGVDGVDGAGKTTFGDELAVVLAPRPTVRISVDDFHRPSAERYRRGRDSADGFWLDSLDYPRLVADVFEPLRHDRRYRDRSHDLVTDAVLDPPWRTAPPGAVVIVDGLFLHRAELVQRWDLTVFLDVPFEVTAARMLRRDGPPARGNQRYVGAARTYFAACDPHGRATVLVDNRDLGSPILVRCRSAVPSPPTPNSSPTST